MPITLTEIEQLARQEFSQRKGTLVFDIPCKQLFDHTTNGALKVVHTAQDNRKVIAQMALDFKDCARTESQVSLRDSLTINDNGATLVRATGCKLMCAVTMNTDGTRSSMTGHLLYMDLKPKVLPDEVAEVVDTLDVDFTKAIYLELVCASSNSGSATLLLLCLLKKLDGAKTGILADAVNSQSDAFFQKFGFRHIRTRNPSLWYLSKQEARRLANKPPARNPADTKGLLDHLRVQEQIRAVCVRQGRTPATSRRTFWDCR
tara:strand:- start:2620 stop:3402 length:783 start_codon:yes stop_codon:yes gene_type:complete